MNNEKRIELEYALVTSSGKSFDAAPEGTAVGSLWLHTWQVNQVDASRGVLDGQDGYLVRIVYETDFDSYGRALGWYEVGFEFTSDDGPVIVADALPYHTARPRQATSYGVNRDLSLTFVENDAEPTVQLPPVADIVDVYGVGGGEVRWRHHPADGSGIRSGARVAWVLLVVPAGAEAVRVQLTGRYNLDADGVDHLPTRRPTPFTLRLPGGAQDGRLIPASTETAPAPKAASDAPRVFIHYAHDDERHKRDALAFALLLDSCNVDVHMDHFDSELTGSRIDWFVWAAQQIKKAEYIIALASPMCRAAGDGDIQDGRHPGMRTEASMIREILHWDRGYWTPRLLPVILPGESIDNLPLYLTPRTTDHYPIRYLSRLGIRDLLKAMGVRPPTE